MNVTCANGAVNCSARISPGNGIGALLLAHLFLSGCGAGTEAAALPDTPVIPPPTTDQTSPQVSIVGPTSGSVVASPVTLVASATDASGIAAVRFFANGSLIAEVTSAPYEATWTAAPGSYSITVEAVDASSSSNVASVSAEYTVAGNSSIIPSAGQWQDQEFTTVYEVGPGKEYSEVSDVPWETVGPDSLIKIFWRSNPYKTKWVINAVGTMSSPIVVMGIPSNGQLPVISGDDAITRVQLSYPNQERSIIKVGGADSPSGSIAEWVFIENLNIQGANAGNLFRASNGQMQAYAENASSVHVQLGRHVYIRNNILRDSGNGLFSGFQSSDLLVSGNRFEDNGNNGSAHQHNSYTESLGIVYEHNYFRPLRAGALGDNLKDRSAGTVIRYNWIESGSRQLDLVDSDHSEIYNAPEYAQTFVYGNILIEPANSNNGNIVHYGGDLSGREDTYRKGTLHFYNNTVISYRTDMMSLLGMSSNDEAADAGNNLIYSPEGGNRVAITSGRGVIQLRGNWLPTGWLSSSSTLTGSVDDLGNVEGSNPEFADLAAMNFRLTPQSTAVNAGHAPTAAMASRPVNLQYEEHQAAVTRPVIDAIDAGAFEFTGQVSIPSPTISTESLANAEVNTAYSRFVSATGGMPPYIWSVSVGSLPAGLNLNAGTGEISGTPQMVETQSFTLLVTDENQQQDDAMLSLSVVAAPPPSGGSDLENYAPVSSLQSLGFISGDLSGIAYVADTNTFFLIQNNGGGLWETDIDFNRIRTISMNGFGDTEDIVHLGGSEFAIVDESSQLFVGTISPSATQISAGNFQRITFDSYSGNSGYEGIAFDPILNTFYAVKESSPKRIRSFERPATSADTSVSTVTPFDANQLPAGDLSSVRLDVRTGRLLILSHESHKLMDVGLDGFVHGELAMADSSQHEGVALDSSFNIYITSEPNSYRVYAQ